MSIPSSRRLRGRRAIGAARKTEQSPEKPSHATVIEDSTSSQASGTLRERLELLFWAWQKVLWRTVATAYAIYVIVQLAKGKPVEKTIMEDLKALVSSW